MTSRPSNGPTPPHYAERRNLASEVPVAWRERPGSKVRLLRDGPRMLESLWLLRRGYGVLPGFVPGVERA